MKELSPRERLRRVFAFEKPDRLPVVEWAGWWTKTAERWHQEGLPAELSAPEDIRAYFGQDAWRQIWIASGGPDLPAPAYHGAPRVPDLDAYERYFTAMYLDPRPRLEALRRWARAHREGEAVVWLTIDGFFWYPRGLMGIEPHLTSFYDCPDYYHRICRDLLAYHKRVFDAVFEILTPDFMTYAEDMSYNHGPMFGKPIFDEFLKPYYLESVAYAKQSGMRILIDTDGDVTVPIEWYTQVGIEGFLPLERMAGVDVAAIRRQHPKLLMLGAFDKTVMHLGEERMRQEFERLLPVMRKGGYVPSCDHQTPPGVSLEDYRLYMRLLNEYARRAIAD